MTDAVGLPRGWAVAALDEVVTPRVEQRPPSQEVPYIDISSIDRQAKSIGELTRVDEASAPTRARQWVRRGDVLVSMTRPNLNAVAIVPQKLDGAVASTGFDVLRAVGVLPEWIFNRVRSQAFVADVCKNLQGVVYPAVRPRDVRAHQLPIPPLGEQHRIAEAIESYLTRLDDAVALLERVEKNLKRYRASVLKAAVEGRLVPTEAELARREGRSYEPANELLARLPQNARVRRGVRQGIELNKEAASVPIPEGWAIASVADLLRAGALVDVKDGNHGTNHPRKEEFTDEGLPFVTAAQLGDFEIDYAGAPKVAGQPLAKLRVGFAEPGDVILSHKGTVGRVAVCTQPCVLTPQTTYYRTNGVVLDAQYLAVHHASPAFQRQLDAVKSQTTRDFVPISKQYGLFVLVPPIGEQRRIGENAVGHLSRIEHLRALFHAASMRGPRLRQSVLKWAFEGKLVDQDPNDEPALVLLDRIRSGRAAST